MKKLLFSAILIMLTLTGCEEKFEDENTPILENQNDQIMLDVSTDDTQLLSNDTEYNESWEESLVYTYEEFQEYIENVKSEIAPFIDYTGENWIAFSGYPVYTQELYESDIARLEKQLDDIKNGEQVRKDRYKLSWLDSNCYDTLAENMNLMCKIEKNKWILYNTENSIIETFASKDDMLDKARVYLSTATMAGDIDFTQSNSVYRELYNAVE